MLKLFCALALSVVALSGCSSDHPPAMGEAHAAPSFAPGDVAPTVRTRIAATVAKMVPDAQPQSIVPMPFAGLYQVVVQGQVLYVTGDGRYVIQGEAFDVAARSSFNSATLDRLRRQAIAKLSPARMIRFAPANPKYTVTVFTDVDCPYCRAFHANMAEMNKLGIAVDYLFWPRTGLGTASAQKAVDVWCAGDRQTALTHAFEGQAPQQETCQSPVAHDFHLGIDLGVDGTPTIIAGNGAVLGGYVDPHELLRRLQAVQTMPPGAEPR